MATMQSIIDSLKPFSEIEGNRVTWTDLGAFETSLNTNTCLGWNDEFDRQVVAVRVNTWICTDTEVGVLAYYWNGEFVALSFQRGRKWDVNIFWKSEEVAKKMHDFIVSLDGKKFCVDLINPIEEVQDEWLTRK